jgi:DNA-binding transcriptional LysR family regulator
MSGSPYDWSDVRIFLACARAGSLSGAGRRLKVDQTTISRRLTALESALRARLFERTPRRCVLTAAGEALLPLAEAIEQGALDFARLATGADERIAGPVRLATSETLSVAFLARALGGLHERHPGIELELVTGPVSTNLLKREADLALRAGVRSTQGTLVARKLGGHDFCLYASKAYVKRRPVRASLAGHDLIGYCDELEDIPPARWLNAQTPSARIALRTNSLLSAREAASGGWGVAALPDFIATERTDLVRVRAQPVARSDFWIIVHPDLQHTARVRAVIEHLVEVMRDRGLGGNA